MLKSGYEREMN